ncbi:MAG TPA: caspase family protein [Xanthobacteraceae bacterium]|nr:caspase family protein [Xanthobacteraceae bacterium]
MTYTIALALGLFCSSLWAESAFAGEKRVALIVGNSAYQNAPALPNPARDARAVAEMFKKAGYDVVSTAYDLGNLDFKRSIRQFEDAAADADIAVVYYAGHGIEIHGVNYVVPVDAKLASDRDADDEAIPLDRLIESVDGAKKLRVIILDACRDNPFSRTMKQQRMASRGITAGLSAAEPTSINTLIAYAAKAGSAAEDGNGDHSPFATALMDNLFVPGLDVRLAFGRVRDEVLKRTSNRQEPFVYGSLGGGNVAIVPGSDQPAAVAGGKAGDADGERSDYSLVEKIGTKGAWQVFLTQHPNGFYAELARAQITKLDGGSSTGTLKVALADVNERNLTTAPGAVPPSAQNQNQKDNVASLAPQKPAAPSGPTSEEQRAWDKIKDSSNEADFQAFIKKYPTSVLADVAQSHIDAIHRQAQDKAAKDAAVAAEAKHQAEIAEAKRQADATEAKHQAEIAELKRQAEVAAKQKAVQDAALAAAQAAAKQAADEAAKQKTAQDAALAAAKVAAQAQVNAEREAALKRDEEAHRTAMAALAEAAKAKQQAEAEAVKKQAEQVAALAAAQQAAQAAEKARQDAQRSAQAQLEAACKSEQDRLTALQAQGVKGRADLKTLQDGMSCDKLRPMVTAALEKANAMPDVNTPAQIKSAQAELARVGCYAGAADGNLGPATTVAIQHYQTGRGSKAAPVDISDALIGDMKKQASRVCPLVCAPGSIADGDKCVAALEKTTKPVAKEEDKSAKKQAAAKPAPAHEEARPAPHAVEQASSGSSHGGGAHGMIGVGF